MYIYIYTYLYALNTNKSCFSAYKYIFRNDSSKVLREKPLFPYHPIKIKPNVRDSNSTYLKPKSHADNRIEFEVPELYSDINS